ncbi:MAG TPA: hypothetical protein VIL00_04495 [Pseudonocardiaceae bacterium]
MSVDISPVIAATTYWLTRAYPAVGGPFSTALAEAQARQAATVAAWLRYPTSTDAALLLLVGPGGAARLDRLALGDLSEPAVRDQPWRTWVDEVVTSWAACLLTDSALAVAAVAALESAEHCQGLPVEFRRLTHPDERDRQAAALLRHPDLLAPVADLHRAALLERLDIADTRGTGALDAA